MHTRSHVLHYGAAPRPPPARRRCCARRPRRPALARTAPPTRRSLTTRRRHVRVAGVKSLPVVGLAAAWLVGLRVRLPRGRLGAGPDPVSRWSARLDERP